MKKTIRLMESELRKMIVDTVNTMLNEETEEQKRKRQKDIQNK